MSRGICLITDSLDRRRGGAESHLVDLVNAFTAAGHSVRVYLRRPENCPSSIHAECIPSFLGWSALGEREFARAVELRLAGKGEIVFSTLPLVIPSVTHYFSPAGLYRTGFEAERASFDPGLRQRFYRLGNRLNFQRQQRLGAQEKMLTRQPPLKVMTLSNAARNQILSNYGSSAASVATIPPGVDLAQFHPGPGASPGTEKLRLLFVGHNARLKGLHCLLRALRVAGQRGLRADLTVIGGAAKRDFKALADTLGVAGQVQFLGALSGDAVGEQYRASDVLIHPAFADHCSLVVLEALASGLPVITTRQNGAAELMLSGREGFILDDPRDIGALSEALLRLEDRQALAAMREAALALRPQLDFATHARRVLAWLTTD